MLLKTLAAAVKAHPERVEIRAQSVASQIEFDVNGRVTGIVYKHYWDTRSRPSMWCGGRTGKSTRSRRIGGRPPETAAGVERGAHEHQLGCNLMDDATLLIWG